MNDTIPDPIPPVDLPDRWGKCLLRWKPDQPPVGTTNLDDIPQEYCVFELPAESRFVHGGCIIYGMYHGKWIANVSARALVTKLIGDRADLLKACVALQMEAKARGCGLRIADEAIAKREGWLS